MKNIALLFLLLCGCSAFAQPKKIKKMDTKIKYETLTLGGGCYWCVEAVYEQLDGVVKVT